MSIPNCSSLTQSFKKEMLDSFIQQFKEDSNNWFIGLANPLPWSYPREDENPFVSSKLTGIGDDPPINRDIEKEKYEIYKRLILLKKIEIEDISFLISRNRWESGRIYDPYRYNQDMFEDPPKNFYVEHENSIYKCIENNNSSQSLFAPEAPSSNFWETFQTDDGYKWKKIYELNISDDLKFSIKGRDAAGNLIPVKFIDYDPDEGDPGQAAEFAQKTIQEQAIQGSISSIYINENYRNFVKPDVSVTTFGTPNNNGVLLAATADVGSTVMTIPTWPGIDTNANALKNMFLKVVRSDPESPSITGEGQIRLIISNTVPFLGETTLTFDEPLDEGISPDTAFIQILPSVRIYGDGEANNPESIKYTNLKSALALAEFDEDQILIGIDLVDSGKNYTFAKAIIPKGILAISESPGDFEDIRNQLLEVSLSPKSGHGSNAIQELGAKNVVIKAKIEPTEQGSPFPVNDFRQIVLIRNPKLKKPIFAIRSSSDLGDVGDPLQQGGFIISKNQFKDGNYEFLVQSTTGTTSEFQPLAQQMYRDSFSLLEFAGQENVKQFRFTVDTTPTTGDVRSMIVGIGNQSDGTLPSFAVGRIRDFTTNFLFVENVRGNFKLGENVIGVSPTSDSRTIGFKINEISDPLLTTRRSVYDMTTRLILDSEGDQQFSQDSFEIDQLVYSFEDDGRLPTSLPPQTVEYKSSAFVINFRIVVQEGLSLPGDPLTNRAIVDVVGAKPNGFQVGDRILYFRKGSPGPKYATINSVIEPEILFGSGDIVHVQNFSGIERDIGSSEEVNLVIGL